MLVIFHIFRKKHFKTNLENFMSESLNATSTPLTRVSTEKKVPPRHSHLFIGDCSSAYYERTIRFET
jgi:hypothetical protein